VRWQAFAQLYRRPILESEFISSSTTEEGCYLQAGDASTAALIVTQLPSSLQRGLQRRLNGGSSGGKAEIWSSVEEMHGAGGLPTAIRAALGDIVAGSSKAQAAKGVISAGVVRSVAYGLAKLKKGQEA